MKTLYWVLLFGAIALLALSLTGGGLSNKSRGFYTADFLEYGNTQDWYVASNTGLHAGTA